MSAHLPELVIVLLDVYVKTINLDLRGKTWQEAEEDSRMRSFLTCTLHQISPDII
jgi:hypothetical protein